jgi:hypothetical protein
MRGACRNTCNECFNRKGYSEASRARKRNEDEVGYLARNAASHSKWTKCNPDKISKQQQLQATDPDRKIKAIKTKAAQTHVPMSDDPDELLVMKLKLEAPCYYCGIAVVKGADLNGLNRIEPAIGYTDANTVASCGVCSSLRGCFSQATFVANIRKIASHRSIEEAPAGSERIRMRPFGGHADARNAEAKTKMDALDIDTKLGIWTNPCYMCGRTPAFGIDREDADGDYTPDNSRPCCADCNFMKKDYKLAELNAHLAHIVRHTRELELVDTPTSALVSFVGKERVPVAMLDASGVPALVFPSASCAANVLAISKTAIMRAITARQTCCKRLWRSATPAEYIAQAVHRSDALRMIRACRPSRP